MKQYKVAVVGATGMVGRKMLEVLAEHKVPVGELVPFASARSAGGKIEFCGKEYEIIELTEQNVKACKADYALFSAGAGVSKTFAPIFAECGAVVIDNSSQWRMDESVPLVVPEVNPAAIKLNRGIIANPNCSTIQAVVALAPLHKAFGIKRIVYSTYQAVSGAGVGGYNDLLGGISGEAPKKFPRPIFANVLPHIDVFLPNGYTKEEEKMIKETRKILGDDSLRITATTVRVPVYYGHSESINVEFEKPAKADEVRKVLEKADGVVVMDDSANAVYPTPRELENRDEVFVGRIRQDESVPSGVNLWVVADNIRKGAATNAVQILEYIISGK
ncbi:aspartate-semialdehyde dehydrogenase [Pumilibacter intestinalis]|uniref:aspartate-semialdehyde dehydrogenase n=1 Tax=Pumilibacter intestinalis TaxID=2941511 RepID=UPI002041E6E6|nr:aspartate-semialdehyde dehydrogenase [Pumilibacter intestinalis]